jgi:hypothetical protein
MWTHKLVGYGLSVCKNSVFSRLHTTWQQHTWTPVPTVDSEYMDALPQLGGRVVCRY